MEILIKQTGNKRILECSKDHLWGTGVALAQEDCLNSDRWITPGIMGKLLEEIRMEFSNHFPCVSASSALSGVCSDPVSSHTMIDSTLPQNCEPNSHPLLGVPANPVSGSAPGIDPSDLHPSMFSGSSSSPCSSGQALEITQSHAGPSEWREELLTDLTPTGQPIENN